MPHMERAFRRQKAVLWKRAYSEDLSRAKGYDDHGQAMVIAATEIKVRWNSKRSEALDQQGNLIALDATVVVGESIPIGSLMWLGKLRDWLGTGSGVDDSDVHRVATYSETLDLKGRVARRECGLQRFRDALPDIV